MNVYGKTEKEREMKLRELIERVKAEREDRIRGSKFTPQ